jgi:thiol-disulfide isomerase/thioredoxin
MEDNSSLLTYFECDRLGLMRETLSVDCIARKSQVEVVTAKHTKVVPPKKSSRLSKAEVAAIPILIVIALWVVYSFAQPSPTSSTLPVTYTSVSLSASGAPDFTLPTVNSEGLTGQSVTLSSFRGKVVLVEFMEPWCIHCQNMAPVLTNLHSQYGDKVVFISVAGPWNDATANDAAAFVADHGTEWIYAYDSSGGVFNTYGVSSTPTFFVIRTDGSVASTYAGEQTPDTLSSALSTAINSSS